MRHSIQHLFSKKESAPDAKRSKGSRDPRHIHVGLDFGSAFTKVVLRDVNAKNAWVFVPETSSKQSNLPFLIPSEIYFGTDHEDNHWLTISRWDASNYVLPYPKLALHAISSEGESSKDLLRAYEEAAANAGIRVEDLVESAACYFLAEVIRSIVSNLKKNADLGFGENEDDFISLCMALPAEDMGNAPIRELFSRVIRRAFWQTFDGSQGDAPIVIDLVTLLEQWVDPTQSELEDWQCSLYPEVSANMAAYTGSKASSEGLFQMFDVGAGTVDVSFFSFTRQSSGPKLSNFSGQLAFCGSSTIERNAAANLAGDTIEALREIKEQGKPGTRAQRQELEQAKEVAGQETQNLSHRSIIEMRGKLPTPNQLNETRLLFVGGGCAKIPYQDAVADCWEGLHRVNRGVANIPRPMDLDGADDSWFKRLTVAYGLSIDSANRPPTSLPGDHQDVDRNSIARPERPQAASKDEC